jgi:hypothetical protein
MSYFGAPSGRKCNCGNEAIYVRPPYRCQPFPELLCDKCGVRADGLEVEVKTMIYAGEIPLSAYEAAHEAGRMARLRHDRAILDAILSR